MVDPFGGDATAAIAACPTTTWTGSVWRCRARRYAGGDWGGSIKVTGRFNRGTDRFSQAETWPALYTGLAPHVALGERLRHTTPASLRALRDQRLSRLWVELQSVIVACAPNGCADLALPGLTVGDLCRPRDYGATHALAEATRAVAEALLIPRCTRFQEGNLIVFPDRLRPGSAVRVAESVDPDLFVDWEQLP